MNDNFKLAQTALLERHGLCVDDLHACIVAASGAGIDYADVYLQVIHSESIGLEEGQVKDSSFAVNKGFGVRAISGEKTGFAYCNDVAKDELINAAYAARNIARSGNDGVVAQPVVQVGHDLYLPNDPLASINEADKLALLHAVDAEARKQDSRIKQVFVSLVGVYEIILVMASDGDFAADVRPLVRLNVNVIAEENGRFESGVSGGGRRAGYNYFLNNNIGLGYAREAARIALINLRAVSAPAGTKQVVLGPGWPGIILHEAVGHGLEGDFNRKKSSAFSDKMGLKVASEVCTIVDNGTLAGELRGSLNIDDEGTPTQNTVLIENGVLKNYMLDKLNARLLGMKSTGNGRRDSFAATPIPRMTNTYMLPGKYTHDEIIASVQDGIYAANFHGGQVDITSGKFVFSTSEAYLIENGRLTAPIKGATLIGDGLSVLTRVSMVGDNLELDEGVGTCGKDGQSVPVGVGQPTLKVDEIVVGGTST